LLQCIGVGPSLEGNLGPEQGRCVEFVSSACRWWAAWETHYFKLAGSGNIAASSEGTDVGTKRKRVKRVKLPGQPKKPSTSYLLFVQSRRNAGQTDGKTGKELLSELGAIWKSLGPDERAPFEKEAAELNAVYKADMDKFKAAHELESEAKRPRVGSEAATDDETAAPAKSSKAKDAKPAIAKPVAAPAPAKPAAVPAAKAAPSAKVRYLIRPC
jgi:hypothetical protein